MTEPNPEATAPSPEAAKPDAYPVHPAAAAAFGHIEGVVGAVSGSRPVQAILHKDNKRQGRVGELFDSVFEIGDTAKSWAADHATSVRQSIQDARRQLPWHDKLSAEEDGPNPTLIQAGALAGAAIYISYAVGVVTYELVDRSGAPQRGNGDAVAGSPLRSSARAGVIISPETATETGGSSQSPGRSPEERIEGMSDYRVQGFLTRGEEECVDDNNGEVIPVPLATDDEDGVDLEVLKGQVTDKSLEQLREAFETGVPSAVIEELGAGALSICLEPMRDGRLLSFTFTDDDLAREWIADAAGIRLP